MNNVEKIVQAFLKDKSIRSGEDAERWLKQLDPLPIERRLEVLKAIAAALSDERINET